MSHNADEEARKPARNFSRPIYRLNHWNACLIVRRCVVV